MTTKSKIETFFLIYSISLLLLCLSDFAVNFSSAGGDYMVLGRRSILMAIDLATCLTAAAVILLNLLKFDSKYIKYAMNIQVFIYISISYLFTGSGRMWSPLVFILIILTFILVNIRSRLKKYTVLSMIAVFCVISVVLVFKPGYGSGEIGFFDRMVNVPVTFIFLIYIVTAMRLLYEVMFKKITKSYMNFMNSKLSMFNIAHNDSQMESSLYVKYKILRRMINSTLSGTKTLSDKINRKSYDDIVCLKSDMERNSAEVIGNWKFLSGLLDEIFSIDVNYDSDYCIELVRYSKIVIFTKDRREIRINLPDVLFEICEELVQKHISDTLNMAKSDLIGAVTRKELENLVFQHRATKNKLNANLTRLRKIFKDNGIDPEIIKGNYRVVRLNIDAGNAFIRDSFAE